jgi:pheromone alpha factor receptor
MSPPRHNQPKILTQALAIFSILQYIVSVPELASNIFSLVTISLPLSSIWAGFTIDQRARDSGMSSSRNNLFQALSFSKEAKTRQSSTVTYASQPSSKSHTLCYAELSPAKQQSDTEAAYGIAVERDISIRSCRKDREAPNA